MEPLRVEPVLLRERADRLVQRAQHRSDVLFGSAGTISNGKRAWVGMVGLRRLP